ncbi:hypothetical protein SteCoe_13273 [Stentor coeruleus]|uniref:Uncharacterized protein n=1 Tax=Stentor coeruleus TaxID=5963 RepID=A0A1R2C8Y6_9CILI|nr:hypothetical protein SteCoe_13273 [Stentor coeruleus]
MLKSTPKKLSPSRKIHKVGLSQGSNFNSLKSKLLSNIRHNKKPLEIPSTITKTRLAEVSFIPKSRYYVQLSPNPSNYDLKGKSMEEDIKSLNKIINYDTIIAKAADIKSQLKSFIIKSSRKTLITNLESLKRSSKGKFTHPKSEQFLKEVKSGNMAGVIEMLIDVPELVRSSDSIDQTALHWACKRGHMEIVKYLLSCKASIYESDMMGRQPEEIAQSKGHFDIASMISGLKRKSRQNTIRMPTMIRTTTNVA